MKPLHVGASRQGQVRARVGTCFRSEPGCQHRCDVGCDTGGGRLSPVRARIWPQALCMPSGHRVSMLTVWLCAATGQVVGAIAHRCPTNGQMRRTGSASVH